MPTEFAVWITPAILIAVTALLLRAMSRLEDRLGARIDGLDKSLNARIDETNKSLGARIDGLDKSLNARIDETNKSLGARIDEINRRIDDLDRSLGARIDGLDQRLRAVEHGQARLEGLLDGLREAIAGRRPAA